MAGLPTECPGGTTAPSIGGWARVTGLNAIFLNGRDPFAHVLVVG